MKKGSVLQEQMAYYAARAGEYDETTQRAGEADPLMARLEAELNAIRQRVARLEPAARVLELACGTGQWTGLLTAIGEQVTVIDGAAEMLMIHRQKLNNPQVIYQQADLFEWSPSEEYELVFFAFWLSHVPPERLVPFLDQVGKAVCAGGKLVIVDEPAGGLQVSGATEAMYQSRTLSDGRSFQIVKVYYDPHQIAAELNARGFKTVVNGGGCVFQLEATKSGL
ncbi:MAG: class I SAM-dependent methyltransferase [Anaerolineae bacterium]|nr:class I SAM-dependent methyltransferase [Anaerolineae bacterium]